MPYSQAAAVLALFARNYVGPLNQADPSRLRLPDTQQCVAARAGVRIAGHHCPYGNFAVQVPAMDPRTTQQLGESQLRNRGLQQLADALRHELHSLRGA